MKNITVTLALLTLAFATSTQAAVYLKIEGVDGEAQVSAQPASPQAEPIQGGLDRDIIRRHSDTTERGKGKQPEARPQATPTTPLPTATQLQGIEPDEID